MLANCITCDTLTNTYMLTLAPQDREAELIKELRRQQENEDLRKVFARQSNSFHTWMNECRSVNTLDKPV